MRKPDVDFHALDDVLVRVFGPRTGFTYHRTASGTSTQVYQLSRDTETFYVRVAEDAASSLGPEAELHRILHDAGVRVPAIVHYEPMVESLARSVMVTTEVPGGPTGATTPTDHIAAIGRAAGRDLARIHSVSVHGFGWVLRDHDVPGWPLRAEHPTYAEYVAPSAAGDPLMGIGFTAAEAQQVESLLVEAVTLGPSGSVGSVAHGDLDTHHIFECAGSYSGLIDLGEIRGTEDTFDLATLHLGADDPATPRIEPHLTAGYAELRPLADDHERRLYLSCVISATHRLCGWFARDGERAADGWFFRSLRGQLATLLKTGQVSGGR